MIVAGDFRKVIPVSLQHHTGNLVVSDEVIDRAIWLQAWTIEGNHEQLTHLLLCRHLSEQLVSHIQTRGCKHHDEARRKGWKISNNSRNERIVRIAESIPSPYDTNKETKGFACLSYWLCAASSVRIARIVSRRFGPERNSSRRIPNGSMTVRNSSSSIRVGRCGLRDVRTDVKLEPRLRLNPIGSDPWMEADCPHSSTLEIKLPEIGYKITRPTIPSSYG